MEDLDVAVIKKRSVQGIVSLISRQFILKLISFAAALVIFTNLNAEESGTYIIVITIQQIISFFTDFGLGAALVQKKGELEQSEISTVFTIQFIVTAVIFILIFVFKDSLQNVIYLFTRSHVSESGIWLLISLAFTLFLSSFKLIPSILLERKIQFQRLVIPQITESLVFNILLVILILQGFRLTSYAWAFAVSGIVSVPVYYFVSPWKPSFGISKNSLSHLKFGAQFQAKNILANFKDKFLKLFLGANFGGNKIGYIGFAETWAYYAYSFVVDSVTKVTFSTYSRLQGESGHAKMAIEKSLFFVSAIMFPVNILLIIAMPYFITFFPRWHKWEPAVISLIFLSLDATVSSLSGILINVLDANGKVKTTLRLMGIWTILIWLFTLLLTKLYDFNGYSIAAFLVTLTIFYTVHLVKKIVDFNFLKSIYHPALATGIMAITTYSFAKLLVTDMISLFFLVMIGGAVYIFAMYLLVGKEIIADIKNIINKK